MCQPRKWWWGLLPVAILFALMIGMTSNPVEGDLARRAADVFNAAGLPWAKADVSGRDAVVTGTAPSPESQKLAVAAAERAWGVRQVTDKTTVSADIKPYAATATREGSKITLTGHVPNDAVRAQVVSAAKASVANAEVVDQLTFGRGAPATYAPALTFGLGQLGKLVRGTVSVSDNALSITGQAADFAGMDQVLAAVKQFPAGATLAKADIAAPRVSPFTFTATKTADQLALAGHVPSEAARTAALEGAKAAGSLRIADSLRVAEGLPAGVDFSQATAFIYAQLAKLKTGVASLSNDALTITGQTDELVDFDAVSGAVRTTLPGGLKLAAQDIKGPAPVTPYTWSANRSQPGTVTLTGHVPSEAARTATVDATKRAFPNVNVVDQLRLAPGAGAGFASHVNTALSYLSKLKTGIASLSNDALTISGQTDELPAYDGVIAGLKGALPDGLKLAAQDIKGPAPVSPYTWSANRSQPGTVTLTGHVPSEAARTATVEATRRAFPNVNVVDQLRLAPGAGAGFASHVNTALSYLVKLKTGIASLSNDALTISGQTDEVPAYDGVIAGLKGALPDGLKLAAQDIKGPAPVSPYTWSANRSQPGTVTLTGYVPSEAARTATVEATRRAFPNVNVVDQLRLAPGAGAGFASHVNTALSYLSKLKTGIASLSNDALTISGQTDEVPAYDGVIAGLKGALPDGLKLAAQDIKGPAPVSPYTWSANRSQPGTVTLTGHVPSEAARTATVEATRRAFPNVNVVDQLRLAPGAGVGFASHVNTALSYLAKLKTGIASLSNDALTISGQTDEVPAYDGVIAGLKGALPDGLKLASQDIKGPAPVTPYTWSANRSQPGTVTLTGFVPSEAARTATVDATKRAFPNVNVVDQLRLAPGAGAGFASHVNTALSYLSKLKTGIASLSNDALTISGQTDEVPAYDSVIAGLKGALPDGLKLASQDIKGPAPVTPYTWSATRTASGLTLAGWIPNENAREPILAAARRALPSVSIVDQMKTGLGAPNGFANAVGVGLTQLGKLTSGVATITNTALKVTGEAADKAAADGVRSAMSGAGVPAGFSAETQISFKEPPPPPPPPVVVPPPPAPVAPPPPPPPVAVAPAPEPVAPAPPPPPPVAPPPPIAVAPPPPTAAQVCQLRFREILSKETIHFATASARITAASRGVLGTLAAAVKACPAMSVEVQGHTDADGSDGMNLELSEDRAEAVVEALEELGAPAGQLKAKGYGKTQPIAPNNTPEGKAKNRRIEFVVSQ